ncbi:alpha/beta-hydrolase [Byssothecium circinans]|uniref:Carboxylic ester hydrolase n=1 Tax=Byssothecium circinans TaxID=147558 RepID=A0A6A5TXB3_9PLEO|nr:alpha/beta-hydrolase [Byssothecium circinans]
MMFSGTTLLLFWYFGAFGLGRPVDQALEGDFERVVTLPGYGSFQGTRVLTNLRNTTTFSSPVDAWLGVEYSTQPVGENRFKPVTWPEAFNGTKAATTYGPACYHNLSSSLQQSEACLNINVYRPSSISLDEKLPVFVFLHGGSFVSGSGRSFDGASFVAKSAQPLVVVTAQYRLGALGTLPAKFIEEEGLLNLGIRDQRQMLEFIRKYIGSFGGDPDQITLGGQSAGGHSVGIHLFHNYGDDAGKPLFSRAILSSGSVTARAFPGVDYALYEAHVSQFMDYVNCPTSPSSAALECLRGLSVNDIQFISSSLYSANNYNITWPWQPVSPGPIFEKRGSKSGKDGTFFKVPILISSVTDEGIPFAPQDLRTNTEFLNFWKRLAPGLTADDLIELENLHPDPINGTGPYVPQTLTYISPQFERISAAYGDYSYICPVQDTASVLSASGAPVYKARFNTPNNSPTFYGVPHGSDGSYFNGQAGTQYPEISDLYSSYYASFVVSGDPNTHAIEGAPTWDTYGGVGGQELVVNPTVQGTKMETEGDDGAIRMQQCAWWRDPERMKRLNK